MSNNQIRTNQFIVFFIIFAGFALTQTQIIPFLSHIGYNPLERGFILSGSAIIGIIGQFFTGYLCDKFNTIKRFYNILIVFYVLFVALMYAYSEQNFLIHLLLISLGGGLFNIVISHIETWSIETNDYMKSQFGSIRAFGAIGWALGAPITSIIINNYGYKFIGVALAILVLMSYAISHSLPDAKKVEKNVNLQIKDIYVLLRNKNYIIVLFTLFLLNIAITADIYTVIDKMIFLGSSNNQIALKWSFQAITEIPLFFFGYYFLRKYGAKKLLVFSTVMLMIRYSLYTLATTPTQMVLISCMQSVTFPLLLISQKVIVSNESPKNLQSTGQMFALSFYIGIPTLITPLISGLLISILDYNTTLLILTLTLIIPLFLSIYYLKVPIKIHEDR